MHPIDNVDLKVYYSQFIKYEVGSEEGVASLLLSTFAKNSDQNTKNYIDDLDIGYISAESSAGEEEFEEAYETSQDKKCKTLILGRDIFSHQRVDNIVKILAVLKRYSDLNIVCLEEEHQRVLDEMDSQELDEVEDLDSYNGTVVYTLYGENNNNSLIGSESFARVAKIVNKDEVFVNCCGEKIKKDFIVDKNLQGTVALCSIADDDTSFLSKGYRFKQVKIEKVDA